MSSPLHGSRTEANLREAFALESESSRRYLYLAQQAEVDGQPEIAELFRAAADGGTGHALAAFDFLAEVADPATGEPLETTEDGLRAAITTETYKHGELYPRFARVARDEGFTEVADWLETAAKADATIAERFTQGLDSLG